VFVLGARDAVSIRIPALIGLVVACVFVVIGIVLLRWYMRSRRRQFNKSEIEPAATQLTVDNAAFDGAGLRAPPGYTRADTLPPGGV
jgi:hypothetical protein